jgi:RNA polymerase sigma factor (sigma-70 family)
MPPPPTDGALLRDARQGDKTALAALVERHYGTLLGACRRMLRDGDLARDAAQDAVLRAMLGLGRLRDEERFGAWLVGIGLNVCRSLLGARARESPLAALSDAAADGRDPAAAAELGELAAGVRAAIAALPDGQRHAVALYYLGGLTLAEIADDVGTRPGAIKTRLHKARRSLRVSLLDTYKEHVAMPEPELIPMRVAELRRTAAADPAEARHVVFLGDDGDRRLPIWIGPAEATSLAVIMEQVELPRPGVYQFAAALLGAAGSHVREVRVNALASYTFYAQVVLADGATVDARPSDALTLALVTGAPIFVAADVLEQADTERGAVGDLLEEAANAPDDSHAIAEEVRSRLAAAAAELAGRDRPG